jgi:Putative restriction endonuclease
MLRERSGSANELRSATGTSIETQTKVREYRRLGVKLGLLVNPQGKKVEIDRLGRELEILESLTAIDCGEGHARFHAEDGEDFLNNESTQSHH